MKVGSDKVWREIFSVTREIDRVAVRAGLFGDTEIATIGRAHEYGSEGIPQRSWMRQTFAIKRAELVALQAKLCTALLARKITPQRAMQLLGAWAAGAIKATITSDGSFAPLAPSTIARKRSAKPLIDTGQLVGSITFQVVP